jgi:hypothetical protein
LDPKRTERVLDCDHAAHHVSLALQALGLPEPERTATDRTLRHQLRAGRSREVVAALRRMAQAQPFESGVWVEIEYLERHEAHLRYDWFRYRGHPLGSGAVESAIRRVVNPRLKGNGISWREENAEAMLALRAAVLTGRWEETVRRAQAARLAVGCGRHRGGVELGSTDQTTSVTTSSLRAGKDDRGVTLFGNPPITRPLLPRRVPRTRRQAPGAVYEAGPGPDVRYRQVAGLLWAVGPVRPR